MEKMYIPVENLYPGKERKKTGNDLHLEKMSSVCMVKATK